MQALQESASVVLAFAVFLFCQASLAHLAPVSLSENDRFFGADTAEIAALAQRATFIARDSRKHPLFSPVAASVYRLVRTVSRGEQAATINTFAALAALNAFTAFWMLTRFASWPMAAAFAAYYAIAFGNLMFWSVPETHVLGTLALVAYSSGLVAVIGSGTAARAILTCGAVGGLAASFNPPVLLLAVPTALLAIRRWGFARGLGIALAAAILSVAIFCAVYAGVFKDFPWQFYTSLASRWAAVANLHSFSSVTFVVVCFTLFSVVSPFHGPQETATIADLAGYFQSPWRLLALMAHLAAIAIVVRYLRRCRDDVAMAMVAAALCFMVFYTWFNPGEAMLYAGQLLFPWTVILMRGWRHQSVPVRWGLGVALVSIAVANVQTVLR